jgi:hypothetical protein
MTENNGKPAIDDARATDLDETRRLAYMALLAKRTKRYNLAGTLVNALKHHHAVDLGADDIVGHVIGVLEGSGDDGDETWLRGQIDRITRELDG